MSIDLERELRKVRGDSPQARMAKVGIAWSEAYRALYGEVNPSTSRQTAPEQATATQETGAPDLRQQTYDLLSRIIEPSTTEKEALKAKRGLVFLPITRQSYAQVVAEDPGHFWQNESEYANSRTALKDFVPPVAVEIGFRESDLALPGSFRRSREVGLQMIEEYSDLLASEFPNFKAIMLPATGYASADRVYAKRNPGQVLFKNYFAWCLDDFSEVYAARAGRADPSRRFGVLDWYRGDASVGAVPAVVKIGTK